MSAAKRIRWYIGIGIVIALPILVLRLLPAFDTKLPPPSPNERDLAATYNRVGLRLYNELRKDHGNLVFSPCSVGIVMAMARAGARGTTEAEMAKVLDHPFAREQVDATNKLLLERLAPGNWRRRGSVAMANALFVTDRDARIDGSYTGTLRTNYAAKVFHNASARSVNAWVAERTGGKIREIVPGMPSGSACTLLNAIDFHGKWLREFDRGKTEPADFHIAEDRAVRVPMMRGGVLTRLLDTEELQAVSLRYKGGDTAMVVILPKKTMGLVDLEEGLTFDALQSTLQALEDSRYLNIEVKLPKFSFRLDTDLIAPLRALGMTLPFSPSEADFSGILGGGGELWIGEIRHAVTIEVDESGTRATAATSARFCKEEAKKDPDCFVVDHPFLFLIVETKTNTILFLGRVTNPQEE